MPLMPTAGRGDNTNYIEERRPGAVIRAAALVSNVARSRCYPASRRPMGRPAVRPRERRCITTDAERSFWCNGDRKHLVHGPHPPLGSGQDHRVPPPEV